MKVIITTYWNTMNIPVCITEDHLITIAAALAFGVLVIAVFMLVVYKRAQSNDKLSGSQDHGGVSTEGTWRSSSSDTTESGKFLRSLLALMMNDFATPKMLMLRIKTSEIEDIEILAKRENSSLWLVKYRGAVMMSKRMDSTVKSPRQVKEFVHEAKLHASFNHPNIIGVVGMAWTSKLDLQILLEFTRFGTLRSWLDETKVSLRGSWTTAKLQIVQDTIDALMYLHSLQPTLVHRDLKSLNVYLSCQLRGKLANFQLSRSHSVDSTMTSALESTYWLAPEIILGRSDYDEKVDIYAFGVMLSEMDTHDLPYSGMVDQGGKQLSSRAIAHLVVSGGISPTFTRDCPTGIRALAFRCLSMDPDDQLS